MLRRIIHLSKHYPMFRHATLLVFFLFCTGVSFGQKRNRLLIKAGQYYGRNAYKDAAERYLRYLNRFGGSDSTGTIYGKLADCYYNMANYSEAVVWYGKQYMLDRKEFAENDFKYGQSLRVIGQYAKADKLLERYYRTNKAEYIPSSQYLPKIDSALTMNYRLSKCRECFSKYSVYPVFMADGELYLSAAETSKVYVNSWNNVPTFDIFKLAGGQMDRVKGINIKGYNQGPLTLSADRSTMYFTSNETAKNNKYGLALMKLFRASKRKGDKWKDVQRLSFNSMGYAMAHPSLSVDEKALYFVSDIPFRGSRGGMDIFRIAIHGDGSFGEMENLTELNTVGDELFPFMAADGTLYFSSNGHPGLGGFDFFRALPDGLGNFKEAVNLGTQINSKMDDLALLINEWGMGYFSSNRENPLKFEAYRFFDTNFVPTPTPEPIEDIRLTKLSGVLLDVETDKVLTDIGLALEDPDGNHLGNIITDQRGKYRFEGLQAKQDTLYVRIQDQGYVPEKIRIPIPKGIRELANFSIWGRRKHSAQIGPGPKEGQGVPGVPREQLEALMEMMLDKNVEFGFNSDALNWRSIMYLDRLAQVMKAFPDVRLLLSGHADSVGTDEYNLLLSEKRVEAIQRYLWALGIDPSRMDSRAYGESLPLDKDCIGDCQKNRTVHITTTKGTSIDLEDMEKNPELKQDWILLKNR